LDRGRREFNEERFIKILISKFKILIIGVIALLIQNCDNLNSEYYCYLGYEQSEEGNYSKAIEYYSKAIELDSKNATAYINRGNVKFILDEDLAAISDYEKAIELDSMFFEAYNNLGNAKMYRYGLDEVENYFNKSIELNSNYSNAYFNRGLMYFGLGNLKNSIKDFEKCIQLNPEDVEAFYLCGLARIENGDEYWGRYDINDARKLGLSQFDESKLLAAINELKLQSNKRTVN